MNQAHRIDPCGCSVCRADRTISRIAWGILYGLAAVGVLVAAWVLYVLVATR